MIVRELLGGIRRVEIDSEAPQVVRTAAAEMAARLGADVVAVADAAGDAAPGAFRIRLARRGRDGEDGVRVCVGRDSSGELEASDPRFLFAATVHLLDVLADRDAAPFGGPGLHLTPAFAWNRTCYDLFLTQEGRVQRGLDRETYVRRLAASGFTHVEVNGLAYPMGLETGPKGEVYPMFYTYCPALDQFVSSTLNKGLYPFYYLSANLAYLKENAALARKHGLVPGLLCFEPRAVPELFFARYPMLRGARVDHPFRSFRPRFTMTLAHPLVREHYAEMVRALLAEVPDLGFLTIWTNDSGAGFEHTKSLYVGRNGGPYMIREWKDDEEIARTAGEHAVRFFGVLRDAARSVNPEFRVLTRLESFYGEHETIWSGFQPGIEVETASLIARGWEMPYRHPRYPDSTAINGGTVYQTGFDAAERVLMDDLEARGSKAHFYFAAGPHQMFAPLVGTPYPRLTWQRLRLLHEQRVRHLSHVGGTFPPELVPFNVNHEILARFQFEPDMDVDQAIEAIARRWAGELGPKLVEAWRLTEDAILAFPNVTPLYSTIGFTWYRLWVRPLVPDIEAIPQAERAYYEDFMCTTPHNPNNVDLGRDVLFQLTTPEKSALDVQRMDAHLFGPLQEAIALLAGLGDCASPRLGPPHAIADQLVRLRALRCWFTTQRNVAAWIAGVHGYLSATAYAERQQHRMNLDEMVEREIGNTRELLALLDSGVEFMATAALGESPLMHGRNLKDLLPLRIALMEAHRHDEPYVDPGYMERMAGRLME